MFWCHRKEAALQASTQTRGNRCLPLMGEEPRRLPRDKRRVSVCSLGPRGARTVGTRGTRESSWCDWDGLTVHFSCKYFSGTVYAVGSVSSLASLAAGVALRRLNAVYFLFIFIFWIKCILDGQ